ncbi:DUF4279 domain-containing protein [Lysobacter solisilvae (ex Woo and Kim 2020)]|uniref:DUF4279 domain-containing protein n=1 Tax=Agrilutibacter terrestris TaxID=2865112 RepID=A0A7H0FVZ5_9GAMM|nr:DUF4279 domain-containing protein [Lysobacter terrestris]QNP40211.1 DUF4279 domain-containing protein [Lysobacter terrestris]
MHQGEVYFRIWGDGFDPDLVTERTGLLPTRVARRGHPTPRHSAWVLSSGKIEGELIDVYALSNGLVAQLAEHTGTLRALIQEHDLSAVLQVVLRFSKDPAISMPAVGFESFTVAFLAGIGASIDVDTYQAG